MIDWLTIHIDVDHCPDLTAGDLFLQLDPQTGEVKRGHQVGSAVTSGDSRVRVKTLAISDSGRGSRLRIDGNPAKFLQGHNIDGPETLDFLLHFVTLICSAVGGQMPSESAWLAADIYRLDLTRSYLLPDERSVLDWLYSAEKSVTLMHRGHGNMSKGSTIYWGKNSRRWAIKAYPKGREIDRVRGGLAAFGSHAQDVLAFARRLLRLELVLRRPHLQKLAKFRISDYSDADFSNLFLNHITKLNIGDQMTHDYSAIEGLTNLERLALESWASGSRVRSLVSQSAFYRLRRKVLSSVGVDIASVRAGSNVVPLLRPVLAEPADMLSCIPVWSRSSARSLPTLKVA